MKRPAEVGAWRFGSVDIWGLQVLVSSSRKHELIIAADSADKVETPLANIPNAIVSGIPV